MKKSHLVLSMSLALTGITQISSAQFLAVIHPRHSSFEDGTPSYPLIGWYEYLEKNCSSANIDNYPDLNTWESIGDITCLGSEKDLPTVGDLSRINGNFYIGNNSNYYNLLNNDTFSGLRSGNNLNFFVKGEELNINNFEADKVVGGDDDLIFNIGEELKKISLTDINTDNVYINGRILKSNVDNINLEIAKTKSSILGGVYISDIANSKLSVSDSTYSAQDIEIIDSTFSSVSFNNVGNSSEAMSFYSDNSIVNNLNLQDSFISSFSLKYPNIDRRNTSLNDMTNLNIKDTNVSDFTYENLSHINDLSIINSNFTYFSLNGDYNYLTPSTINNITLKDVVSAVSIEFNNINSIEEINISKNLNIGGENNYIELDFEGTPEGKGIEQGSIKTLNIKDYNSEYGSINLENYKNIDKLVLDNIEGSIYSNFDFTGTVGDFTLSNSNYGNFIYLKSKNMNSLNILEGYMDNFFDIAVDQNIGNISFDNFGLGDYLKIEANTINNVIIKDTIIDEYIDINTAEELSNITIENSYSANFITFNNAKNVNITNYGNENFLSFSANNELVELSLNLSEIDAYESAGFVSISGYKTIKDITATNSDFRAGFYINLLNSVDGNGSIEKMSITNVTANDVNGDGNQITNVANFKELEIINNNGSETPNFIFGNLENGIDKITITNTGSEPTVFIDRDFSFSDLTNFSNLSNFIIEFESINAVDGITFDSKLDRESVFCSQYGISTKLYYSDYDRIDKTGTMINKGLICQ